MSREYCLFRIEQAVLDQFANQVFTAFFGAIVGKRTGSSSVPWKVGNKNAQAKRSESRRQVGHDAGVGGEPMKQNDVAARFALRRFNNSRDEAASTRLDAKRLGVVRGWESDGETGDA
jgi:hypothetical protein